jgi:hypothetical protein
MKSRVSITLATLVVLPAMSCAQDRRPAPNQNSAQIRRRDVKQHQADDRVVGEDGKSPDSTHSDIGKSPRRLESVTWNSVKHELTWVISKGEKKEGASYKALANENYEINMDDATMNFSGETRRFSKEEAANVHVLMDLIAKYAVDSTIWWADGQGEPVNGDGKGTKEPEKPRNHTRPSDNSVAILHVGAGAAPHRTLSPAELQTEIRETEEKLRELKRLQTMMGGQVQLTSYSPETY